MTKRERKLFHDLGVALDHWLHQYAPEQCYPKYVKATAQAMMDAGGPLAYFAELRQRIRRTVRKP